MLNKNAVTTKKIFKTKNLFISFVSKHSVFPNIKAIEIPACPIIENIFDFKRDKYAVKIAQAKISKYSVISPIILK